MIIVSYFVSYTVGELSAAVVTTEELPGTYEENKRRRDTESGRLN